MKINLTPIAVLLLFSIFASTTLSAQKCLYTRNYIDRISGEKEIRTTKKTLKFTPFQDLEAAMESTSDGDSTEMIIEFQAGRDDWFSMEPGKNIILKLDNDELIYLHVDNLRFSEVRGKEITGTQWLVVRCVLHQSHIDKLLQSPVNLIRFNVKENQDEVKIDYVLKKEKKYSIQKLINCIYELNES